jgi:hypothetical protein
MVKGELMRGEVAHVAVLIVVFISAAAPAFAGVTTVPEIDGGSLATGLGLLAGGMLMLRARRGARKEN